MLGSDGLKWEISEFVALLSCRNMTHWYLIETLNDNSWCVVHEKNVLVAGSVINVGDETTFFYQGSQYEGKILFKDHDHEVLNNKLKELKEGLGRSTRKVVSSVPSSSSMPVSGKRKTTQVNFYGASNEPPKRKGKKTDTRPQMTEQEKSRMRILELNKSMAQKRSNSELLSRLKSNKKEEDADADWNPGEDDESQDSVIENTAAHFNELKADRNDLLKSLSCGHQSTIKPSPQEARSPTKDELKRELEILKSKLLLELDSKAKGDNQLQFKARGSSAQDNFMDEGYSSRDNLQLNVCSPPEKSNKDKAPSINDALIEENFNLSSDQHDSMERASGSHDGYQDDSQEKSSKQLARKNGNTSQKGLPEDNLNKSIDQHESSADDITLSEEFEELNHQLYGKKPNTSILCKNIYCKTDELTKALTNANNVNQLIRRLMVGVFVPSQVHNCTVTGQAWRAGGAEKAKEKRQSLHPRALRAIVDYANSVAKKKKWNTKKFEKCTSTFSTKLTEIKSMYLAGKLTD